MKNKSISRILLISIFLMTAAHSAWSLEDGVRINGFIAQGYLQTDKNNFQTDTEEGSFQFNDMGINFSTMLSNNLYLGLQLFARDLGNLGNDEVTLDWAYGDYLFTNALGLRAGKIKIPFGLYNETRDIDMMRTSIFLPDSIYSEAWRDTLISMKGVGIYGTLVSHFSYQIQSGTTECPLDGGIAKQFMGLTRGTTTSFTTENFSIASLQLFDLIEGLKLQGGYYYWKFHLEMENLFGLGYDATSKGEINTWIASLEYIYNRFSLSMEYSIFKYDAPMVINTPPMIVDPSTDMLHYYIQMAYQLTDFFTVGAYYSESFLFKDNRDGKNWERETGNPAHSAFSKNTCVSLRFDINSNWIFKVEGHYFEGTEYAFILDNLDENGNIDLEKYWKLVAAKVMYVF